MSDNPILSIYVPTFNHEKYIVQALDSILMQETSYPYEVLVGEDLSIDRTRAVLKAYEIAHPGKLQVFYREENMWGKPINNGTDLIMRCRGKYIIALEGDDFWIDPLKLEKQISFLETHPDYYAVAHNCIVVGDDSRPNGEQYPECKDLEYTFDHFFQSILPGQLATCMYRNTELDKEFDDSLLKKGLVPGDRLKCFAFLCHGKIRCIQEPMSAYRHVTNQGSSYSANRKFLYEKERIWYGELAAYAERHCEKKICVQTQYLCFGVVLQGLKNRQISLGTAFRHGGEIRHKPSVLFFGLKRLLGRAFGYRRQEIF